MILLRHCWFWEAVRKRRLKELESCPGLGESITHDTGSYLVDLDAGATGLHGVRGWGWMGVDLIRIRSRWREGLGAYLR